MSLFPMPRRRSPAGSGSSSRSSGQSLVEFALVLPILLLLVLVAIDFGRIYLGYVNAQQMARIAANYAANNATDLAPTPNTDVLEEYRRLVGNDARQINCELPDPLPGPIFEEGTDLGDPVLVSIPCRFAIITPIIGAILGGDVLLTADATFPVKQGAVTAVGGNAPVVPEPDAAFLAAPLSGYAPLSVRFYDISEHQPTSWVWTFGDGSTSLDQSPTHVYANPGTYTVVLEVSNPGGQDFESKADYIEVLPRPTTLPVADFEADVQAGPTPLDVEFTDRSTGDPTDWLWDFGDGASSSSQNPSHRYAAAGTYDVTLTVTSADGTNSQIKRAFILVSQFPCVVPNFANTPSRNAQATWNDAGFTTRVDFLKKGNFTVKYQSLPGGLTNPPNQCAAIIELGP